MRVQLDFNCSY